MRLVEDMRPGEALLIGLSLDALQRQTQMLIEQKHHIQHLHSCGWSPRHNNNITTLDALLDSRVMARHLITLCF